MRHEILLASTSAAFCSEIRRETPAHDFILDAVDSSEKWALLSKKRVSPDLAILDLDFMCGNLYTFIFYLKQLKRGMPVVVVSGNLDASLMDEVNKNLFVLLSLPRPTSKQKIKNLFTSIDDFFNEDLKKKLIKAEYLKEENVFACTFANKEIFFMKRDSLPEEDQKTGILSCEISPDKYYFTIKYDNGGSAAVPWDFIRYKVDQNGLFSEGKKKEKTANLTAEAIGQRIINTRAGKEMTQEALASKTGILRNNLSRIENGRHHPSLPILEKIASALEIPVVSLLAK